MRERTSFASPLDSILFRDSTHSFHFAHPLGTTRTSIPPFASLSSDTDVPTSAVLGSPFFSLLHVPYVSLPLPLTSSSNSPRFLSRLVTAAFPSFFDPPLSFVRRFQPSLPHPRQLLPPSPVRTSNIVDMSRLRLENRECTPTTGRFVCVQVCTNRQVHVESNAVLSFPENFGIFAGANEGLAARR